jgi:hypothetical protein
MPALALTEASQALFVEIFQRARHWNGEPILDEAGPLLKKGLRKSPCTVILYV